jgi:phasin
MKEMPMANTETTKSARTAKTAAEKATSATTESVASMQSAAKEMSDAAFAYPKFEVPEVFRSFAEQGLSQTREAYSRMKAAAEEATDLFEESFETTREGVREVQFKALDVVKENTDAALDLMRKLLTATSVADAVQLQTTFARERFEAMVDYSKDVQATWSKVGAEATKPAKTIFDKAMSLSKAA